MNREPCPMCGAADCDRTKLDACPIYFEIRDALLPGSDEVSAQGALALFWLARQVALLPAREREGVAGDLAALFREAVAAASASPPTSDEPVH